MKKLELMCDAQSYSYDVPATWDELTNAQLLFFVSIVSADRITVEEAKTKMLLFCIGGRIRKANADSGFEIQIGTVHFLLSAAQVQAMAALFDYLFDSSGQICSWLLRNPYPTVRIDGELLTGPSDGFTSLTYADFVELQLAVSAATKDTAMDAPGVLYKGQNGKPSPLYSRLPSDQKMAVFFFYLGCMNLLQERFPIVFSGTGSSGDIADSQMRIIDALAKNDVTKKYAVRHSDLYEALYTLEIAAEECERLKKS